MRLRSKQTTPSYWTKCRTPSARWRTKALHLSQCGVFVCVCGTYQSCPSYPPLPPTDQSVLSVLHSWNIPLYCHIVLELIDVNPTFACRLPRIWEGNQQGHLQKKLLGLFSVLHLYWLDPPRLWVNHELSWNRPNQSDGNQSMVSPVLHLQRRIGLPGVTNAQRQAHSKRNRTGKRVKGWKHPSLYLWKLSVVFYLPGVMVILSWFALLLWKK